MKELFLEHMSFMPELINSVVYDDSTKIKNKVSSPPKRGTIVLAGNMVQERDSL